ARVFNAFADYEAKKKWFGGGDEWQPLIREFDFRIGGQERDKGRFIASGDISDFQCFYHDITPDERIVYSYRMHVNDALISVSLATIETTPAGSGAKLKITEQGAFLNGYADEGSRKRGTEELLDALVASLGG